MENEEFLRLCKAKVAEYTNSHMDKTDGKQITVQDVYVVWSCKTLQNSKALLSTTVPDGMYYELTYKDVYKRQEEDSAPCGMSVTEYTSGLEKGKLTELRKYEGILGQIQAIEDALTRVQARQQKAIEMLHKFGYDDAKLELATMQLEFEMLKQDNQAEEDVYKRQEHICAHACSLAQSQISGGRRL